MTVQLFHSVFHIFVERDSTSVWQDENRLHLSAERQWPTVTDVVRGGIEKAESMGTEALETKQRISPGNPISITITVAGDTRGRQGRRTSGASAVAARLLT